VAEAAGCSRLRAGGSIDKLVVMKSGRARREKSGGGSRDYFARRRQGSGCSNVYGKDRNIIARTARNAYTPVLKRFRAACPFPESAGIRRELP
jgi:hypothetical protein